MNLDLKFFYYPVKQILDAKDEEYVAMWPIMNEFEKYINSVSIPKVIKLIIITYKERYAQQKYWYRGFLKFGASNIEIEYPKNIDEESDLYASKEKLQRDDFEHVLMRQYDDFAKNTFLLKEFEIKFSNPQNIAVLQSAVEAGLDGKTFIVSSTANIIGFVIEDSPISEIEISATKFLMKINPNKWIWYPAS